MTRFWPENKHRGPTWAGEDPSPMEWIPGVDNIPIKYREGARPMSYRNSRFVHRTRMKHFDMPGDRWDIMEDGKPRGGLRFGKWWRSRSFRLRIENEFIRPKPRYRDSTPRYWMRARQINMDQVIWILTARQSTPINGNGTRTGLETITT